MTFTKSKSQLLVGLLAVLTSCTITTTKRKDPVFNDVGKAESDFTSYVHAENINLAGKEITSNGKTIAELNVAITNAKDVPPGDDERRALEKSIAKKVKSNLKDSNEYDQYAVTFITRETSGALTKRTSIGNVFSSKEL